MQASPYTPGAISHVVPGREEPLAHIEERLQYLAQLGRLVGRIRVDYAPRGLGKTSMLREAQRRADDHDLLTIWTTATRHGRLVDAIVAELERQTAHWERSKAFTDKLDGFTFTLSAGVAGVGGEISWRKPAPSRATQVAARAFEDVLLEATTLASQHGKTGIVLFIDEIQDADPESLGVLAYAWQDLQAENPRVPAAVFADGLPNSKRVISEAVSPSERFNYQSLGPLSDDAVRIALAGAARTMDVTWSDRALDMAAEFCAGYPHSVQLVGDYAWQAAGYPEPGTEIGPDHVRVGIARAEQDLQESFEARLSRIERPREREFVAAMASLGDDAVSRVDVAAALGMSSASISDLRQHLLDQGVIEEAGRGELRFTAPGFASYVRDHFGLS